MRSDVAFVLWFLCGKIIGLPPFEKARRQKAATRPAFFLFLQNASGRPFYWVHFISWSMLCCNLQVLRFWAWLSILCKTRTAIIGKVIFTPPSLPWWPFLQPSLTPVIGTTCGWLGSDFALLSLQPFTESLSSCPMHRGGLKMVNIMQFFPLHLQSTKCHRDSTNSFDIAYQCSKDL